MSFHSCDIRMGGGSTKLRQIIQISSYSQHFFLLIGRSSKLPKTFFRALEYNVVNRTYWCFVGEGEGEIGIFGPSVHCVKDLNFYSGRILCRPLPSIENL